MTLFSKRQPVVGDLRVWHCPQIPCTPFHRPVRSLVEAKNLIEALADYDLFQLQNNIKPDYCNASGLERYEADAGEGEPGWCEWYDDETGDEIDDASLARLMELDAAATGSKP